MGNHVLDNGFRLVRVFVGIDADGLSVYGDRIGVLAALVVACHVVMDALPCGTVSGGILGKIKDVACLVVCDGMRQFLDACRVSNGIECLALDFVALDL